MGNVPKYQEPQLDPVFGQLLAQSQQQSIAATQQDLASQKSRLAARFGTANYGASGAGATAPAIPMQGHGLLTSADPGALLAWHGMQMAAGGIKLPGLTGLTGR